DELRFELNKTAMDEEKYGDLWRQIWEREDIQLFLENPDAYDRGGVRSNGIIEDVLARFGLVTKPPISQRHPNVWKTIERARTRFDELNEITGTAVNNITATGNVHRLANRGWYAMFILML